MESIILLKMDGFFMKHAAVLFLGSFLIAGIFISGCVFSPSLQLTDRSTPTPQIVYVTVTSTPTPQIVYVTVTSVQTSCSGYPFALSAGEAGYDVYVRTNSNGNWVALPGARVVITSTHGTCTQYSSETGIASFHLPASTDIKVTAYLNGYNALTRSDKTGTAGTSGGTSMELSPS